jgi:hypothetical protein
VSLKSYCFAPEDDEEDKRCREDEYEKGDEGDIIHILRIHSQEEFQEDDEEKEYECEKEDV